MKFDLICLHCARKKAFGSSATHHDGARGSSGKGIGKHLSVIVSTSASGHVLPPILVFEDVYQMDH